MSSTRVESWPASRVKREASVPASASTAVRAAVEPGSAARSSHADQKRDRTVPRPEPDGSGKAASAADRTFSRAFQYPDAATCSLIWVSRNASRMRLIEVIWTPVPTGRAGPCG